MSGAVVIEGLADLRAELPRLPDASAREVTKALRGGAVKVTALAQQYAPVRTGALRASLRPFATQRSAGVRSNLVYAGVQEFGRAWLRQTQTGSVTMHYKGATPRFAHKAVNQAAPGLVDETFAAITEILLLHGWFDRG